MVDEFRWNDWNLEHATVHGVTVAECESVIRQAKRPYPEDIGDDKFRVVGRGQGGRFIHAIFTLDADGVAFVIHARPIIKANEKRRTRRRGK